MKLIATCPECERVFDLGHEDDAEEWSYGHDCEVEPDGEPDRVVSARIALPWPMPETSTTEPYPAKEI
jgi:hypothetical protein